MRGLKCRPILRHLKPELKRLSRRATAEDAAHILEMARCFYQETRPDWPWDGDAFKSNLSIWIDSHFVTVSERGFCVGIIAPYPLSPSWVQAHEIFLWAKDGTGGKHKAAFKKWAKASGANAIEWSCRADNERVARHFNKIATPTTLGFTEVI